MNTVPSGQQRLRRCVIVLGGTLMVMIAWSVLQDPMEELRTDWTAFDNAASRLLDGERVYRPWDGENETLPYLYPPFALWLTLPLGLAGFFGSWLISAGLALAAFLVGAKLLVGLDRVGDLGVRSAMAATGMIAALTTGTVFNSVLIGQYSGIYVLAVGLGLWLYVNDRPALAGLALAILVLKPNIAIAVPIVLVWSRSWRVLLGFGIGSILALISSLPFGLDRWSGFAANVSQMADLQAMGIVPTQKMVTFSAMFEELFGTRAESLVAIGAWLLFTLVVGVATLVVWTPARLRENPQRAFAVWAIFVIIANPRMFFYDGTLVVFGVLGLWMLPTEILGARTRRFLPAMAVVLWVASWGAAFTTLNLLVAPFGAALILLVAIDAFGASGQGTGKGAQDDDISQLEVDGSLERGSSWSDSVLGA